LCVFLLSGSEILSKHYAKLWLFFSKYLRYLKSKIWPKFHRLLFLFIFLAFFTSFFFLFHLSKLIQKLLNFVYYFIGRIRDMWNNFFPNSAKYYLFFYYVQHFLFYFIYLYLSKNSENFYVLLFYGLEILLKDFRKSRNIFPQNYRHLKSKILHKFHRSLFFYIFFIIFDLFYPYFTYPNLSKSSKHFCGTLLYGL